MLCGWEGNCRSGVALAVRHRLSGIATYRLSGLWQGDEHPAYSPFGIATPLPNGLLLCVSCLYCSLLCTDSRVLLRTFSCILRGVSVVNKLIVNMMCYTVLHCSDVLMQNCMFIEDVIKKIVAPFTVWNDVLSFHCSSFTTVPYTVWGQGGMVLKRMCGEG